MENVLSIYVITRESLPFLLEPGMAQLRAHLKARSRHGETIIVAYPPFYHKEAVRLEAKILEAEYLETRLRLRSAAEAWFRQDAYPVLEAVGGHFNIESIGYPPTASPALWERFFLRCVQNFAGSLARMLDATLWTRSPARLVLSTGKSEWSVPAAMPKERLKTVVVSGAVLTHAYEQHLHVEHTGLPFTTLLPSQDRQVLALLIKAYPQATFLFFGSGATYELPPDLDRIIPSQLKVEVIPFVSSSKPS